MFRDLWRSVSDRFRVERRGASHRDGLRQIMTTQAGDTKAERGVARASPRFFRWLIAFCVGLIVMGGRMGCDSSRDHGPAPPVPPPSPAAQSPMIVTVSPKALAEADIEVRPVTHGEFRLHREFPATVQPNENTLAEITPLIRGRVEAVYVDFGQDVKAGTPLVRLHSTDLGLAQAAYLKGRAKLREAELAFERARDLHQDRAVSLAEVQRREAEMLTMRAEAEEASKRLELMGVGEGEIERLDRERTIRSVVPVRAPFAGRVIARNVTRGEVVETTHKMFTLADLSDVWVVANVPEKDVQFIHRDQEVDVRVKAYPGRIFRGTLTYIGDVLDPSTRTMRLRVTVPNLDRKLKPEMFAMVHVYTDVKTGVVSVPLASVQRDDNRTLVFVRLDPGRFEARRITLGEEHGEMVEVLDGLREGEQVVTRGAFALKSEMDKTKIEPTR